MNHHRLQEIRTVVMEVASECQAESQSLLALLRILEELHRQIRTEMFEPALPNTRKDLYQLLRDIEETGGWPYIERMRLQSLLQKLSSWEESPTDSPETEYP